MNCRGRGRKQRTDNNNTTTTNNNINKERERKRESAATLSSDEKLMLDPCPLFIDFFFVLFDFVFVIGRFTRFGKQQQQQRQWQWQWQQQWQEQPQQLHLQHRSCTPHPMQSHALYTQRTSPNSTVNAAMALLHILPLFILYKWRRWRLDIALYHGRTLKCSRNIIHTQHHACWPRSQIQTHTFTWTTKIRVSRSI